MQAQHNSASVSPIKNITYGKGTVSTEANRNLFLSICSN